MRFSFYAAIFAALFLAAAAHAQTPGVGTVAQLQGTASVTRQGATQALNTGDAIASEDILETGPASKLLVTFTDGTALTLGPNADVVIDEFVYNPDGGRNNAALRVTAGAARFVAGALERVGGTEAIKVSTPVATIGIRGTDFFVEMDGQHLSVALFSGYRVAVANAAGETLLRPGEGTDIYGGNAPTQALTWGTDRVNRALALVTITQRTQRPLPYAQPTAPADDLGTALVAGKFKLDARYRYEHVDRESQARNATASTLRVRASYETQSFNGFFAGVGGEFTTDLGAGNRHSNGVVNTPGLPVIADPESEVLNLAYVGWSMADKNDLTHTRAVVGRQRFNFENERWVGAVGFRQNDQTFDAAMLETRPIEGVSLRYAYVDRVNRILGNNPGGHWRSDSHMFGATTSLVPFGLVTAYAYLLDLRPVPVLSSATYGLRYDALVQANDDLSFGLEAEVARQTDYAANPQNYALTYALIRPNVKWASAAGMTMLAAGWERLDGNGLSAVQTPLATLHRHNGWADVFLNTPANGIDDFHVRVMQEFPDLGFVKSPKLDLRYHRFNAANGGARYGEEFDADINGNILGRTTVGLRFAKYNAKSFDTDTTKLWLYVEFQY